MKKSFRDPSGFVYISGADVYRAIHPIFKEDCNKLINEIWFQELVAEKKIQSSVWIEESSLDEDYAWLKHDKFDFPLYPHQISAEQLFNSALLTLEVAQKAFKNGWVLKDASAWNVVSLFGSQQFCDITSFEVYDESSMWVAYGQFCRHYIIPLLLFKHLALSPAELFTLNRDGITPKKAKQLLGLRAYLSLAAIEVIILPEILKPTQRSSAESHKNINQDLNKIIFSNTLQRLKKYVGALRPSKFLTKSIWSDYEEHRQHYNQSDLDQKYNFVKKALEMSCNAVLDLGCNQGQYSLIGASLGLNVVASDFDENALIKLQAKLSDQSINVMFLNFAQPTPSIGWKNQEHESFLSQAKGYFGIVLCLGLIHHLLVSERVPLEEVLNSLATLSNQYVLIEWVNPDDEKFIEIASVNASLYKDFNERYFEEMADKRFHILDRLNLEKASRTLYLLQKK